jgi:glutamate carboxypeptidase
MLAKQPFRVDGDRAYGLGISDDKQGIALILHTVDSLKKLKFNEYGKITVLINGDEEISSPALECAVTVQTSNSGCPASRRSNSPPA